MPYLALVLTLALVAGLAGGVVADRAFALIASVAVAAGWLATVLGFARRAPHAQLSGVVIALVGAGWLLGAHAVDRALHPTLRTALEQRIGGLSPDSADAIASSREPILVEGRLMQDSSPTDGGVSLRVQVERIWLGPCPEPAIGGIAVGVGGALHADHVGQWTAGRLIRAPVLLRRPARYLNDGVPDQERALARRGITLVGSIKSATLVEVVARGRWWEEAAAAVRARTRRALARHVRPLGTQPVAMATAILIGDRAGLEPETEQRLQEAGTYHVIAISGGNIAILAGLVIAALASLGVRGRRAALVTLATLTAYGLIAAGGASVARATLMAAIYLAAKLIDQRTAAANAIALAAGVLLLVNPLNVADVGFWLTVGATAAILVGTSLSQTPQPPAAARPAAGRGWWRSAVGSVRSMLITVLIASACAELALMPISALVFERVTLAGLLVNFAALPAMTVVQVGAMTVVACDVAGLDAMAGLAGVAVYWGTVGLIDSARLLDYAPWLTWRVPAPGAGVVAAYYASLIAAAASALPVAAVLRARYLAPLPIPIIIRVASGVAALSFVWIVTAPAARVRAMGDGRLHVRMIDVGQGDATLVTFPNGRTLLVDTGGSGGAFDVGDRVVGPALRATRLVRLDYLAITHGDPDHIGGARSIVRDFSPGEVWYGVPVDAHAPAEALQQEAARARATWRWLQRGDRLAIGGVELRVHHPPLPDWARQRVRNDDSLVFELRFGGVSMVLTGDIGRDVEAALLPTLDLLPLAVLKVPHHGSATSSAKAFVERVAPAIALIGVGRGNPYGHPVPAVLGRYHDTGTRVFRTDLDGQITLRTDGRSVVVQTWTGQTAHVAR